MTPFKTITSTIISLPQKNIDTDQIIPAEYLKVTNKDGLAEGLFAGWSRKEDGSLDPDFPLNKPEYQKAEILLVGDNFGCGSSREHAPWALLGRGIRAVISTSFADIFRGNALKNGLLPVEIDQETHQELLDLVDELREVEITIDLTHQMVTLPTGRKAYFPIDGFSKLCLLEGVDQLGYLLKQKEKITAFEQKYLEKIS